MQSLPKSSSGRGSQIKELWYVILFCDGIPANRLPHNASSQKAFPSKFSMRYEIVNEIIIFNVKEILVQNVAELSELSCVKSRVDNAY